MMLLMQQHFAQLLHLPEMQKLQHCLLLLLLLQLHAAHWLQQPQNLNQIKQLALDWKTIFYLKNSSKQVDDDWDVDYDSEGIYPNLVVNEDANACAQGVD